MKGVLLYGASGHAKVIIDCLNETGKKVLAFFDDNEKLKDLVGIPVIGPYDKAKYVDAEIVISIGNNIHRKRCSEMVSHSFCNIIHPGSIISNTVKLGNGNAIFQGTIIQADTCIGNHVIINTSACVDHDCVLEDFSHVSPNATLCGNVLVGEGAHIGAGAVIIPGVKIGDWAVVGAGSVITEDVPAGAVVVGNGRIIRYNDE